MNEAHCDTVTGRVQKVLKVQKELSQCNMLVFKENICTVLRYESRGAMVQKCVVVVLKWGSLGPIHSGA